MFTGLVTDVGAIDRVAETAAGRELRVRCRWQDLAEGESVAVNGACLTVLERGDGWFTVAAVWTTLERTAIGDWREGTRVNLERALRVGDRLGGHFVQGHVDCVARVVHRQAAGDALLLRIQLPDDVARLMVLHGSIAVDGVSLTVNALPDPNTVELSIIEYTAGHTTLGSLRDGDRVHVEADMIAKHVQQLLAAQLPSLT
ncbi:MAG TPA: riboflavin synthase [Gemmatimonadaceae bacterium]|nr:riboflavin synthase [Gemmatimonadaceae bacterium]